MITPPDPQPNIALGRGIQVAGSAGVVLDPDAVSFIAAAGIEDETIVAAVDQLVVDLKTAGVWTKLDALYPMVGGTADTHKWNLKDPRDLDAAFRLTFTGTWTHSATGAAPNGSTAYADTKYAPSTHWSSSNGAMGFYSRTNSAGPGNPYDMGCSSAGDTKATICIARYNNERAYMTHGTDSYTSNYASADGRGMFVSNRASSTESAGCRNGTVMGTTVTDTCVYDTGRTVYLAANNRGGTATYFSAKEQALAFLGDSLTAQNIADFYTAVQAFQTTLDREV